MSGPYDDIINLPHPDSHTRPRMSMKERAAQFSPFAALTGYDSAVKETARLTDEKIEPDEEALNILNRKFQLLEDAPDEGGIVSITYFRPDEKKSGGAYVSVTGAVKKMDDAARRIVLCDGTKIPMDDVLDVEGELFAALE